MTTEYERLPDRLREEAEWYRDPGEHSREGCLETANLLDEAAVGLENLWQLVKDEAEEDKAWRAAAGEWDKSDSNCSESAAVVIERLRAALNSTDGSHKP